MSSHEPLCSGEKLCKGCNRVKSVLAFSARKENKDGLKNLCRDCCNSTPGQKRSKEKKRIAKGEKRTAKLRMRKFFSTD